MKKTFTKISIVLMFLAALPAVEISAQTDDKVPEPEYSKDGTTLISCDKSYASDDFVYDVKEGTTTIGDGAFSGNEGLKIVNLASTVTKIGASAFSGANSIFNLGLNNVLSEIGDNAFQNMPKLMYLHFPHTLSSLGASAFNFNTSLQAIEIYDTGIKEIQENTFRNVSAKSIALPNSVITIGSRAFVNTKLTYFTIPNSCKSISVGGRKSGSFNNSTVGYLNIPTYNENLLDALKDNFDNQITNPILMVPADDADKYKAVWSDNTKIISQRSEDVPSRVWTPFTHSYPVKYLKNGAERFFRVNDASLTSENSEDFGKGIRVLNLIEVTAEVTKKDGYVPANFPLLVFCNNGGKNGKVTWEIVPDNPEKDNEYSALYSGNFTYTYTKDGKEEQAEYPKYNPLVGTPGAIRLDQYTENESKDYFRSEHAVVGGYENFILESRNRFPTGAYYSVAYKELDSNALWPGESTYLRLKIYGKNDDNPDVPVIDPQPGLSVQNIRPLAIRGVSMRIGSDTTTGITDIDADTDAVNAFNNHGEGRWYRLDGTSTDSKPTAAGLYIHNGKKIVIGK